MRWQEYSAGVWECPEGWRAYCDILGADGEWHGREWVRDRSGLRLRVYVTRSRAWIAARGLAMDMAMTQLSGEWEGSACDD